MFNRYPEARYRITQLAFVQEHALVEAQNVINRLQWELQQARQAQSQQQQRPSSPWGAGAQPQQQSGGGFFSGLFGGGSSSRQPPPPPPQYAPPPPQYPPGYQPGMFAQRGSGFLGSALTTAAGVAGGMLAGDALMNLFRGGGGGYGTGFGGGFAPTPVGFTPEAVPGRQSVGRRRGAAPDPYDAGGARQGFVGYRLDRHRSGRRTTPQQDSGWQDTSSRTIQRLAGYTRRRTSGFQDASNDGGGWTDTGTDTTG